MTYIERPRFSCALGGALETITSINGLAPIIHASSGCGGNLFSSQQSAGSYGAGYCGGLCMSSTNVLEQDIIFGGEARLKEQIRNTLEIIDAGLYMVVTGCMTEIIGDDSDTVISGFREKGWPVLALHTGGFKGNAYTGYDLVLQALFTEVVRTAAVPVKNHVNLWGAVPAQDPFFRGDLAELKRLLARLGVEANTFFGYDESLETLKDAGAASLNIVLSRTYGLAAAKAFEEKHGTPTLVRDMPIGEQATGQFLLDVAGALDIDRLAAEKVVEDERARYYHYLERILDAYLDSDMQHYAIVVSNANYCGPVTRFLAQELGWLPELAVVTDALTEVQEHAARASLAKIAGFEEADLVFETDASQIIRHYSKRHTIPGDYQAIHASRPLFVLGSTYEQDLAESLGANALSISFPVLDRAVLDRGYAGFRGGIHLIEDIVSAVLAWR